MSFFNDVLVMVSDWSVIFAESVGFSFGLLGPDT